MLLYKSIESLDEIHCCLLRILMWNYHSKVNYLCVKLRVHFRVFRKKCRQWFWQFLVGRLLLSIQTTSLTVTKISCQLALVTVHDNEVDAS
jgi:hypothetical protein